jgi:hypothetical protein
MDEPGGTAYFQRQWPTGGQAESAVIPNAAGSRRRRAGWRFAPGEFSITKLMCKLETEIDRNEIWPDNAITNEAHECDQAKPRFPGIHVD